MELETPNARAEENGSRPVVDPVVLRRVLKDTFGYASFRPLQESIIADCLLGRDVLALLPTGGGKSLCYQLPALVRPGLTVVISPLIALMKDQVDALRVNGVAATYLNSTLAEGEKRARWRGLHTGAFKLLYVAPERLLLGTMPDELARWNVQCVAVDEAHCISEWGHDFRPEYRQMGILREKLASVPFLALTATATERVREDILAQLRLRSPAVYVASFNRPNLTYRVVPKDGPTRQVLAFLKERRAESGIIYCASRAGADALAERLLAQGVPAAAYHAGLEKEARSGVQERFLRDEVRVICATIAFGMGINKPNVRFVLHHDLPKNIESYYQETGRAGRDGLPGDYVLLFSAGDVAKQLGFIEEKADPKEQQLARQQLRQMVHYAESAGCRRSALLGYFGESYPELNCGACDNCLNPRESYDATIAAQKLLSCVYRIRQRSQMDFGMNHVVSVLTGGESERLKHHGHDQLSTFGIGKEHSRNEWGAIGRELMRLGYLIQQTGEYPTIALTSEGLAALKDRRRIHIARPIVAPVASRKRTRREGEIECDELLFDKLRALRRKLASEQGVPPYIVFGDVTLRWMARDYPVTPDEMHAISGVGEAKFRAYGEVFLTEIRDHVRVNPRRTFSG